MLAMLAPCVSHAESIVPVIHYVVVPKPDRRALEKLACAPRGSRLTFTVGMDFDQDPHVYHALARCGSVSRVDGHKVYSERLCLLDQGWTCEEPEDVVMAHFRDRRVEIRAEDVSLQDAVGAVSHLVRRQAFAPAEVESWYWEKDRLPLDTCRVSPLTKGHYKVDCQNEVREVERVAEGTVTTYRQVPLYGCADKDQPACQFIP